eukprot:gene9127-12311_t
MLTSNQIDKIKTRVVVYIPTPIRNHHRRKYFSKHIYKHNPYSPQDVIFLWIFGTKTGKELESDVDISTVYQDNPHIPQKDIIFTSCRDDGDEWDNANGTSSTTCKTYEAIKYIYQRYQAEYVWRGADDAYLNIQYFIQLLNEKVYPLERAWIGSLRPKHGYDIDLNPNSQPNLQKLFGLQSFSYSYMLGIGFGMTYDIVQLISNWNIPPHQTWCEDVMLGMWLNIFQINKINEQFLILNRPGSRHSPNDFIDNNDNNHHENENDVLYGVKILVLHRMEIMDWHHIDKDGIIYLPLKNVPPFTRGKVIRKTIRQIHQH